MNSSRIVVTLLLIALGSVTANKGLRGLQGGVVCGDAAAECDYDDSGELVCEECDDGNKQTGDGCSPECTIEPNHRCFVQRDPSHCWSVSCPCESVMHIKTEQELELYYTGSPVDNKTRTAADPSDCAAQCLAIEACRVFAWAEEPDELVEPKCHLFKDMQMLKDWTGYTSGTKLCAPGPCATTTPPTTSTSTSTSTAAPTTTTKPTTKTPTTTTAKPTAPPAQPPAECAKPEGPVLEWLFEGDGDQILDTSGAGHHAPIHEGTRIFDTERGGQVLALSQPHSSIIVSLSQAPKAGGPFTYVGPGWGVFFFRSKSNGVINIGTTNGQRFTKKEYAPGLVEADKWTMVTFSQDAEELCRLYFDAELMGSKDMNATGEWTTPTRFKLKRVGGRIDDVMLVDRQLSGEAVMQLYQGCRMPATTPIPSTTTTTRKPATSSTTSTSTAAPTTMQLTTTAPPTTTTTATTSTITTAAPTTTQPTTTVVPSTTTTLKPTTKPTTPPTEPLDDCVRPPGAILVWLFEGEGDEITDSSGQGNHPSIGDSTRVFDEERGGQVLSVRKGHQQIRVSPVWGLPAGHPFTVSFWIKPLDYVTASKASNRDSIGAGWGTFHFRVTSGMGGGATAYTSASTMRPRDTMPTRLGTSPKTNG
ncbi:unnamed protein product [Vitrella brassicaformis CCMP3155]|uniref:Apple domain-containing protein n=1 Tax=Vitrella brassicaformis (strain CCMP3155) TaxID=1169540 RepID=A0A0G4EA18_VITBC|nr:unnamed protein product [Vitrella brassicaformis CCMP3155]|eukprot:CEL92047.1 unnamed protein product [Vitrella brassicaformis CCMP3155]